MRAKKISTAKIFTIRKKINTERIITSITAFNKAGLIIFYFTRFDGIGSNSEAVRINNLINRKNSSFKLTDEYSTTFSTIAYYERKTK